MQVSFFIAFAAAAVCGTLAGMGLGGGSLLVLWLTAFMGAAPQAARGINLLFFLPAALIATLSRIRKGTLQIKKVMPAVWAGIGAAFIFSCLGSYLHVETLKKLFGLLLLVTGLRELFYRPRKPK